MHAFESLHKAMCDGTLRVIGSKGEGRSPKRISSRKCKRLKPTKVVIPANRSAPRGVRFDLINKSEVPTPLVETDKPIGFTGLRVRSDDLYGLWPKNQEANAPRDFLDLQRCLDELIKYSGQDFPSKVTAREIGQSNALLVHLERACHILDKQGRKHPKIDKGLVLDNAQEWIDSLSKILAHDGPSGAAQ